MSMSHQSFLSQIVPLFLVLIPPLGILLSMYWGCFCPLPPLSLLSHNFQSLLWVLCVLILIYYGVLLCPTCCPLMWGFWDLFGVQSLQGLSLTVSVIASVLLSFSLCRYLHILLCLFCLFSCFFLCFFVSWCQFSSLFWLWEVFFLKIAFIIFWNFQKK